MNKEAMKLALEAFQRLDLWLKVRYQVGLVGFELDAIKALEEALAKQEQGEPVAHIGKIQFERLKDCGLVTTSLTSHKAFENDIALYTTPQPAQKPLTKKQIKVALADMSKLALPFGDLVEAIARAIEAAHGIKENT